MFLPIDLAYECRWCVGVSSTPCCCNIGHMLLLWSLLAGRTVSVNPVPYAPGPSSPRSVARGELRLVSVYHDEDCVHFPAVRVVVVLAVFDVGVHDAGGLVAAIVGVFEVVPSVCAAAATLIGFQGKNVAVVEGEGEGGGECVAVTVHVGEGDVGDVAAA